MSKKNKHRGQIVSKYRRTIIQYINKYHNHRYVASPSNRQLECDILDIINTINDDALRASFTDCKNNRDRLQFFYNYIKSTMPEVTGNASLKTSKKLRPIQSRKITQSWVDGKISKLDGDDKWKAVRYQALKAGGGKCCLCGRSAHDGIKLHVDHIKPKSIYPELMYDVDNLQVLCDECNVGKCNFDDTDWRQKNKLTPVEVDKIIESKQWERATSKPKYLKRKKHDAEFKPIDDGKYITVQVKTGVTSGRFR